MFGLNKKPKEIKAKYYEGLQGILPDSSCSIIIGEYDLLISKTDSDISVTIPFDQISSIDIMWEKEFQKRYHNVEMALTSGEILFNYYLINYTNAQGENKYIAFRNSDNPFTTDKIYKLSKQVLKYNKQTK